MSTRSLSRNALRLPLAVGAATAAVLALAVVPAAANHPVLVEGNCFNAGTAGQRDGGTPAGAQQASLGLRQSPVAPGTCGDVDGDGRIGAAEDSDGDNNFGSITAAVNAVANNGKVTIAATGTFPETVTLAPTNNATLVLEGAPGVDANLDAVVQGDPAGSAARQGQPGIVVNGDDTSRVVVRNVGTRNWTAGVRVLGVSHATLDGVRADSNVTYGIEVLDRAKVAISQSDVNASGVRRNAGGVSTANPGIGIEFSGSSRGDVVDTSVTGSRAAGIAVEDDAKVKIKDVQSFDNNPNFLYSNDDDRDDDKDGDEDGDRD